MDSSSGSPVPGFSYRERFVLVLGIAVIVFSAFAIFGDASKVLFICLLALSLVSLLVIQQINELRKTSTRLSESEERFRLLLAEVEDYAIFALSPAGKIASWNHGAERMTGYLADEVIGKPFFILRASGKSAESETNQIFETALKNGRFQEEAWYSAKGGRRFLTHMSLTPLQIRGKEHRGFCVVLGDITAKKQAEHELLESYRFIERITRTIPNIIFILNLDDLQAVYMNEEVRSILGYSEGNVSEMGAKLFQTLLHPDDLPNFFKLRQLCTGMPDGQILELDCRMKKALDGWGWLSCRIVVFSRSPDGTPAQILGIAQDVTPLKESQAESKRIAQLAFSQQRLATLGELSAGVAHEIRNPLQAILSCVEELRIHCDRDAKNIVSTLNLLEEGLQRMDQISGRLLRLARNPVGEKVPTDLAQCISGTCAFVQSRAQKCGITLQIDVEPELPLVPMNAEIISEALLNLLNNAMDACTAGGRVSLSAQRSAVPGMLEIRVADSGCGIPLDVRAHIFEAFFTTKAVGKGTGLGMTIVKRNVEAHGGQVELSETSANGTVFTVRIPLA